ncbi:alpha/beta hydrolase family protein [Nonomuraea polychroma]|uniref:Alpha/beta hydrolase family protein n=1 Tax=Nonomuraea polychroma TaxID=46176 RepID=A0A438MJL1_9ACTN|nr:alpha/beta fold hydrolase [Nonomuraea polychroma]RVX46057.1 alpha/beta hydrolase family protein [Nonomuraea polychroma]
MAAGLSAALACVKQFSETDFTAELPKIDIPVLVVHGEDDQIVSIAASALKMVELLPQATSKVVPGAPHGLVGVRADVQRRIAGVREELNVRAAVNAMPPWPRVRVDASAIRRRDTVRAVHGVPEGGAGGDAQFGEDPV